MRQCAPTGCCGTLSRCRRKGDRRCPGRLPLVASNRGTHPAPAEHIMPGVLLCRVGSDGPPPRSHFQGFLLRISVAFLSDAISLSEALKRPERSFGGTTASMASSLSDGSTRVYISVVCVCA